MAELEIPVQIVDSYDCAKSGCPGGEPGAMARCSCAVNCGAPGCRGYALEEDMPWRGGGVNPGE